VQQRVTDLVGQRLYLLRPFVVRRYANAPRKA
jgi:hypothetical protein